MVTLGVYTAISMESLPKRRPQEVWQDGAPLSLTRRKKKEALKICGHMSTDQESCSL